ncbi:aminotransferase class IV [Ferruginibacter lapsinanis]|uniref:aminotransferase class IV n=1 Tax=Ferruginibacter lapsinanis TaxID=563172 RepID=UPI001E5533C0|nr:aminotransferase class IV [Ferruginibacter lapsinanis]UEG48944.1 aminotransferase class IV [Ferruginibacter lapsinanis]
MSIFFYHNGKFYSEGTLIVGAENRGLRYGDGLFETMKIINGKIIAEDDHLARLWAGMKVLQFDVPKHFTPDKVLEAIIALAKKNNHLNAARVRLTVYRGDGGLFDAVSHQPDYIIQTWALPESNGQWNSNGLVLGIYTDVKKSCDILSNLKHNNYLPYIMAALHAKKEKWNDAVVLNTFGRVCETTIANIFIIKENRIFTPSLKEGCVAGVFRRTFLRNVAAAGYAVIEKEITTDELQNADEVFLTNSIYNIRWVQRIGDKEFLNTVTQKIYSDISSTIY